METTNEKRKRAMNHFTRGRIMLGILNYASSL